jgi:hypothetical protein
MDIYEVFVALIGILVSIVAFFLIRTMSKLDVTYEMAQQNKLDTALLKQEQDINIKHMNEKLDEIKGTVNEIRQDVKSNNKANS